MGKLIGTVQKPR